MGGYIIQPNIKTDKTYPIVPFTGKSLDYAEIGESTMQEEDMLTPPEEKLSPVSVEKEDLDDKDVKLINYLMKHNHTSPFEHCTLTMRFVVPLFIRSQHHRHRTWAYNEISRRYTGIDMRFYSPEEFRTQHKSNRQASNDELVNPVLNSSYLQIGFEKASLQAARCSSVAVRSFLPL